MKDLSIEELLRVLAKKAPEVMQGWLQSQNPVKEPYTVSFRYPGTDYEALLHIEPADAQGDPNLLRPSIGMHIKGSDRLVSHILPVKTREDTLSWLVSKEVQEQIVDHCKQLKESLDKQ